jgi:hypothetical protein
MRSNLLGRCPRCETPIPVAQRIIEYETPSGVWVYSECPECHEVVHPERY